MIVRYAGVVIGVVLIVAFLMLISEFKMGARIAQLGIIVAILVVALQHQTQIVDFLHTAEGKPVSP